MPHPTHSRRHVVRGLAWSVPAVAATAAAPAFATSPCPNPLTYTAKFTQPDTNTIPLTYSWTANGGSAASAITARVSTTAYNGKTLLANNLTAAGNRNRGYQGAGDLATDGLQFQQKGTGGQRITITFSKPVENLSFTIADIDWNENSYQDSIWVSPSPTSVTLRSAVTGAATQAAPLKALGKGEVDSSVTANRAVVTLAGPVSSFTIDFSTAAGNGDQQTFLTGLSFKTC